MIAQSIDCTEDFLTERNTECISEGGKFCVQSMIMQGRGHFMNNPGQGRSTLVRDNTHELTIFWPFLFKLHVAIALREQCVISSNANISARVNSRATLPDDDIPRRHFLTAINLHTQSFGF